jgi:hypothetical protein
MFEPLLKYPLTEDLKLGIFLNELWNEWTILGKHECFHQIRYDIIILLSQFLQQISKTSMNISMCLANYKKPQSNFFKNFASRKEMLIGDNSIVVTYKRSILKFENVNT